MSTPAMPSDLVVATGHPREGRATDKPHGEIPDLMTMAAIVITRKEPTGPTDSQMEAVKQLQVPLRVLGKLCANVMSTGEGDWELAVSELESAIMICKAHAPSDLAPSSGTRSSPVVAGAGRKFHLQIAR
jgi:hypothetical protein